MTTTAERFSDVMGRVRDVLEAAPLSLRAVKHPIDIETGDGISAAELAKGGARGRLYTIDRDGGSELEHESSAHVDIVRTITIYTFEYVDGATNLETQKDELTDFLEDVGRQLYSTADVRATLESAHLVEYVPEMSALIGSVDLAVRHLFDYSA